MAISLRLAAKMANPMVHSAEAFTAVISLKKGGRVSYTRLIGRISEYKRSSISMRETPSEFTVRIEAKDATALKASLNAILKDIQVIESVRRVKVPQIRQKSKNI